MQCTKDPHPRTSWSKGKLVGQKAPFKPKEVWAIRARLQMENRGRGTVLQQKTQRPVQFEISPDTREAVGAWVRKASLRCDHYLPPSRVRRSPLWALASTPISSTGGHRSLGWIRRGLRDPIRCGVPRRC
jgi:hypothetical protein